VSRVRFPPWLDKKRKTNLLIIIKKHRKTGGLETRFYFVVLRPPYRVCFGCFTTPFASGRIVLRKCTVRFRLPSTRYHYRLPRNNHTGYRRLGPGRRISKFRTRFGRGEWRARRSRNDRVSVLLGYYLFAGKPNAGRLVSGQGLATVDRTWRDFEPRVWFVPRLIRTVYFVVSNPKPFRSKRITLIKPKWFAFEIRS